ncbi:MAG TPA: NfeD family protein [Terriglobales bacterium]|nr:NfeD family protein [Terriglobales bacterium]
MNWELFYLICFILGFVFSTLSFLTGTLHMHLPTKWHVHAGKAGLTTKAGPSFFNTFSLMAFLTWFGGMGYLLTRYSSLWAGLALLLATVAGLTGAAIVFWFFARVLLKHDIGIDAAEYDMIGVLGRVSSSIRSQGTGEIVFEQVGTRRSCGARSEDGVPIVKGTEVVVTRYERGIAYVRAWDEIAGEAEANAGEASKL